jgi:hypothetical protein
MRRLIVAVGLALVAALPSTALAHGGNPDFRSIIHGVRPSLPGVSVSVLGYDNQLQLINRSGKDVTIEGYDGEPYARVLADGTVEENRNSPATYLNADRSGATPVPKFANSKKAPSWRVVDKTGRFIWHDHRMHWMARGLPPQVKSKDKKTKIFDYGIPIEMGGTKATVSGTLFWVGPNNGFPVAPFVVLAAIVALSVVLVIRTRRRRAAEAAAEIAGAGAAPQGLDAPAPAPEPATSKEAW